MKKIAILFLLTVCLSFMNGATNNTFKGKAPKYVFLFIGDGMALSQISSTEIYLGSESSKTPGVKMLAFTQFPSQGVTTTYDAGSFITDSASAGTAIATGNKTLNGVVNMDTTKTVKYTTMAEMAKQKGYKIGIVSSVSLDHATPACFYAHQPSRGNYYEIGLELANSNFDYFGGGGFLSPTGKNKDKESVFDVAKKNGYKVAVTKSEFSKLTKNDGKVLAVNEILADGNSLNYELDRAESDLSLADFTAKGIELLDNKNGFFMMVEGGKIDWACHANDAMSAIKDVVAFDNAIKKAIEFQKKYPNDTLIIVTGDHETGGMSIGFAGTEYMTFFTKLKDQKISYVKFDEEIKKLKSGNPSLKFDDVMPIIKTSFGLTTEAGKDLSLTPYELNQLKDAFAQSMIDAKARVKDETSIIAYGTYDPLSVTITHILNRKAGIAWTTYSHSGVPVQTYASGVGQNLFDGYYDNTDLYKKITSIMGVTAKK